MSSRVLPWPVLLLLAATAVAGVGSTASRLAHAGPGRPVVETAVIAPEVPVGAPGARATGTLSARDVVLPPVGDRGSRTTDAAHGLPSSAPTDGEAAKLALARDAITVAEAAGTRALRPVDLADASFSAEELDAIKRQQAAARLEALVAPQSGPLPGEGTEPTRSFPDTEGPDGLGEREIEKLRKEGLR